MTAVLIPLDLSRRPAELLGRMLRLMKQTAGSGLTVVIALADRGGVADQRLTEAARDFGHVAVATDAVVADQPNLSRLRNCAAAVAGDDIIILLDADIAPDVTLLHGLARQVEKGAPLAMAPCLYLSHAGTCALLSGQLDRDGIVRSSLAFEPDLVLHWAMPSSVMAMRASSYSAVGGFHEGYEGYGYEDLDFMIRLAVAQDCIAPLPALLLDRPYRAPLLAEGFRASLGSLCLANLLDGAIALHLFHEKESADRYIRQRSINGTLFRRRIAAILPERAEPCAAEAVPAIVSRFYAECGRRARDPADFHALFDARPRHMLIRRHFHSRVWRQVRSHLWWTS